MVKVRYREAIVRIPVVDDSGDHDGKLHEEELESIKNALQLMQDRSGFGIQWQGYDPVFATGTGNTRLQAGRPPSLDEGFSRFIVAKDRIAAVPNSDLGLSQPASQSDPVINTAVTDREMNSSAPDVSLQEFRERPERTRGAPRPRANSWRHGDGST